MRSCFLFALLGVAANVSALSLDFGNVAPREGRVELRVNGTAIGTPGYLQFGQAVVASGAVSVEARSLDTGATLAAASFTLDPERGITPILLLHGNGEEEPFSLALYQTVLGEDGRYPSDASGRIYVAYHHAGVLPKTPEGTETRLGTLAWCSGKDPGSFWAGGDFGWVDWYYGAMRGTRFTTHTDYSVKECGLLVQGFFGSVRLAAPYDAQRDSRYIFAGDGETFPYTITLVGEGGEVLASTGALEPEPGAVFRSQHVWYDQTRPAQAVALYPLTGSDALVAYWYTHDTSGESTWFFLDGVSAGTARYELDVYRASGDRADPLEEAGSAQLVFADCNNAEIRMIGGEAGTQTLRLKRSMPVVDCELPGE